MRRRLGFVPAFDGLRGVAVLAVVLYHFRLTLDPWTTRWLHLRNWTLTVDAHPSRFSDLVPRGGFLGVDIFFVLSGFLITALLLREQHTTGRIGRVAFYRRRAFRLLPALALFIVGHVVFAAITHISAAHESSAMTSVVFYYFNWKLVYGLLTVPPALAHLWSLSVEEQFYLVWPFVTILLLGSRQRLRVVVGVIGTAVVAIAIWRAVLVHHQSPFLVYFRTDARADSLLIGALTAHLWTRGKDIPARMLAPAAWVATAFLAFCLFHFESTDHFLFYGGFTAVAIAVAIIVLAVVGGSWRPARLLTPRPLRAIGRVSYGLYLWHPLTFAITSQHMRTFSPVVRIAAALAFTTAIVVFSWFAVERPFLRLKDRMEARTPRPSPVGEHP